MGILEIHFHDSEFSWSFGAGDERTLSLGTGNESNEETTGATEETPEATESGGPALAPKLRSFAVMALVVGGAIAYNRLQARREREAEATESKGRLSLSRSS